MARWLWILAGTPVGALALLALGCAASGEPGSSEQSPAPTPAAEQPPPAPPAPPTAATPEVAATREQVHMILSEHCGECHHRSSPGALDGALAIYDLDEPDWYAGLDDSQLDGMRSRLEGQLSDADLRLVNRFAAERRAALKSY